MQSRVFPFICLAFTVLALLAVTSLKTYEAYRWKQLADTRGWRADQCAAYLFAPTDVKTAAGDAVSRATLIDSLLVKALAK